LHASELGGGGPHAASHETGGGDKVHFADLERSSTDVTLHDSLTSAPHISQAEKDRIHDRLHTLDSVNDHSGAITDTQHGSRGSGLHADSHARQHALGSSLDHTGSGTIKTTLSFAVVGTLSIGTDKAPTLLAPCSLTIVKVKLVVKTAPGGQAIIVDVNKNGTTIFTTQGNRPQIAAGQTTGDSGTPDVTGLAEGDKVTIDVDQVGASPAGADLTVEVVCDQTVVFS